MALPSQQACISCHNDAGELNRARTVKKFQDRSPVASSGENRDLGDGVIRFLTPASAQRKRCRPSRALPRDIRPSPTSSLTCTIPPC